MLYSYVDKLDIHAYVHLELFFLQFVILEGLRVLTAAWDHYYTLLWAVMVVVYPPREVFFCTFLVLTTWVA